MTRDDLVIRVRENLNAPEGASFYSSGDLNDSIQDGYDDVAAFTGCITKISGNINWGNNQPYYDLRSIISDFFAVVAVFNNNTNQFLLPVSSRKVFQRWKENWELWAGQSQYFTPISPTQIAVAPRLATGSGNFYVIYKATANTLASNTTPTILPHFQVLLENYSTADLLEQKQEFKKAGQFWEDYFKEVRNYKDAMADLAKPDRERYLRCLFGLPLR